MNMPTNNIIKLNQHIKDILLYKIEHKDTKDISLESLLDLYSQLETKKVITRKHVSRKITEMIAFTKENVREISIKNNNLNNKKEILLNMKTSLPITDNSIINTSEVNVLNDTDTNSNNKPKISKNRYIRTISPFNLELASYSNIFYHFNKNNNKIIKNIYSIIESSFYSMSSLISKPVYYINPNNMKIQLFYYWHPLKKRFKVSNLHSKFLILNEAKLKKLSLFLSHIFKKSVELEITRIYYPHYDSNILANLLGLIINVSKFRIIRKRLFSVAKIKNPSKLTKKINTAIVPAFLSGIRLKLAGRILSKNLSVKVKSKTIQRGTLARTKATFVSTSRFTSKNRRGAFSITVNTGHLIID
uniref:Small ribosomal subunit protein uS3m n=1 Tax=Hericium coralloides TaxID=100756 RepID=A0A1P8NNK4_HERCO|nr:hypothetical protein [Hericium coralloides]APX41117.1 hypothetical protein [Hericium coralloides]